MPLQAGTKNYFTFVQGLITEASALTFPENASIDEDNFVLNSNGSRQRRLGMDFENEYVLKDIGMTHAIMESLAVTSYRWDYVANDPTLTFGVIQTGNKLWFVDLYSSSISANFKNSGNAVEVSGSTGEDKYTFASVNGYLVVAGKDFSPIVLKYIADTDTIDNETIEILVRDFWGIDSGYSTSYRPTGGEIVRFDGPADITINRFIRAADTPDIILHKYNLYNQGWNEANITAFLTATTTYPSSADIMFLGKKADGTFDSTLLTNQVFGNTAAPKGHFVIDAFDRGASRATVSELDVPSESEQGRPSIVAPYAGRVFYAGVVSSVLNESSTSPDFNGYLFFSQLVDKVEDLGKCFQENDPTAEHNPDLLATDGGYIRIAEANNILHIEQTGRSLVIFAENGVWELTGDSDAGFTALSYQVRRVTNVGCVNGSSVVNAEGTMFYWSKGGIYILRPDEVSGYLVAQNITVNSIQSFFSAIPAVAKANAVGSFDTAAKKISWLYNDADDYDGTTYKNKYNRELIYDATIGAFYTYSFSSLDTDSPYISGYVITPNFVVEDYLNSVVAGGDQVTVGGEDVAITTAVRARGFSVTKYLTVIPGTVGNCAITFSHLKNDRFVDWQTHDAIGADYSSYLVTGYELAGDAMRQKQSPWIVFHFNRTEIGFEIGGDGNLVALSPSSCLVTPYWDFADHTNSGKIGTQFQAYRLNRPYIPSGIGDEFNYGQSVITTKNKVRGRGRALSLKIESEAGKDMYLLGWSAMYTIGQSV